MRNRKCIPASHLVRLSVACLLGSTGYLSTAYAVDHQATGHADYVYVDAMMPPLPPSKASTIAQSKNTTSAGSENADFAGFLGALNTATYEQTSRSSVSGRASFMEMKRYLQNRYNGVTVVKSLSQDGAIFDCIPVSEQPGLRDGSALASPPDKSPIVRGAINSLAVSQQCPSGTIPLERVSLDQLTHFATLKQFLSKDAAPIRPRVGAVTASAASANAHHYASMFADTGGSPIAGAGADLNIWNPSFVTSNDYMSISQIWLDGQSDTNQTQTLEVGWQRRPSYSNWGNKSIFFIYSTQDGYVSTGCHNLDCGEFVQTASGNIFGVAFSSSRYSVKNGSQGVVKVAFQRNTDGNWWLNVDGNWVGYYKAALYSGDLASTSASTVFTAGGETFANGGAPSTPMGSGVFASNGYKQAAFQANHFYIDDGLSSHAVTRLSAFDISDPGCYTMAVAGQSYNGIVTGVSSIAASPEMTTGEGFYFGGPGCTQ